MTTVWDSSTYNGPGGVVTIGNFDGVHLGHQALLRAAASENAGPVIAYTFHPAPRDVLRPDNGIRRIQRLHDRVEGLLAHGADTVVVEPFDLDFAARTPQSFALDILRDRLRATAVVVGWDFRFGRGRAGNAEGLRASLSVPVTQVPALHHEGAPASSSRVRTCLQRGAVAEATRLLTRPHRVFGTVVEGLKRGRTLGFPTANLRVLTPSLPSSGVYACTVGPHLAVANLGSRPTFADAPPSVEVHLLDFDGDLYGTELAVDFHHRIRDERSFDGADALVEQILADVTTARSLLS